MLKRFLLAVGMILLAGLGFVLLRMGPRNVLGMLRYDQRQEGKLHVGDAAPDVELASLDGSGQVHLAKFIGGRPLVLVFGSYT